MQFRTFHEYVESRADEPQKCGGCGVPMDQGNPNRTLRVLEDPQGGIVGTYCPNCYDRKKKELEAARQKPVPRMSGSKIWMV